MHRLPIRKLAQQTLKLLETPDINPHTPKQPAKNLNTPLTSDRRRRSGRHNKHRPKRRFLELGADEVLRLDRLRLHVMLVHRIRRGEVILVARFEARDGPCPRAEHGDHTSADVVEC